MNNEIEALLNSHIARLETLVTGRDNDNPFDRELNKVDRKNIASLREGRVPCYGDHIFQLGDGDFPMDEFKDIVEEQQLAMPV
jgi:hypothetical protein